MTYEIVVTNSGPSGVPNVNFTDSLPNVLTGLVVSTSQGSCLFSGPYTLVCDTGPLGAGKSVTVTVVGNVPGNATADLVNTAALGQPSGYTDPNPSNNNITILTQVVPQADLQLFKTATATVNAGQDIYYTVKVVNNGPSTAQNVEVTDTLPVGVTYQDAASTAACFETAPGSGVVKCPAGALNAGASITFTIVAKANANLQPGTSLENIAQVTSTTADSNPNNNTDNADTSIVSQADVSVTKSGPATVTAGGTVTYNILVTNSGPSTAQSVDVKDQLPAGVSFVSGTATGGGVCVSGICQLGNIPAGQTRSITIVGQVDSDIPVGTQLTNTATVFSDSPDPNSGNNSATASSTVQTSADVRVTKVDLQDPVGPTEGFLYEIVVTNSGPSDALNVVATDTLGANLTFAGASAGCTNAGQTVTCTVGTLPAGQSVSFLIAVKAGNVADGTVLNNSVTVSSSTPDPNPNNNTDSETTTVQTPLGPATDLAITKTGTASVIAGQNATYTLTVTNKGPLAATNVQVLDLIPAGTTVVSITANNPDDTNESCSLGGACYLGKLNVNSIATITLVLKVNPDYQASTVVNKAAVFGDQAELTPADNQASATTNVTKSANLSIVKVDMTDPVIAGEVLTYQIKVSNAGPSEAENVVVTDNVPANTTFVGASPECSLGGSTVTCQLGTVAAGATENVFISVRVNQNTPNGTTITNTATVGSTTPDPNSANNSSTATTTANQSALNPTDLSIDKTDTPDPVIAGQNLTYALTVTNNGPAPATSVMVVDALPSGVSFISASASNGGVCNSGITCSLGTLTPGQVVIITIVVKVSDLQFGSLVNYARVSASNPDPSPNNNDNSEITNVNTIADISVVKTASPSPAIPGQKLTYEILVTNNGPSGAQKVIINDNVPAALQNVVVTSSQGSCSFAGPGALVCNLGPMAANAKATITIVGTIDPAATGTISNTAYVTSCNCTNDPNDTNNSSVVTTPLVPTADLQLNKLATPTVYAGQNITYQIDVFNAGPSTASQIQVLDTLPPGVTYQSAGSTIGCGETAPNSGVIKCIAFSLPAGNTMTFTIVVKTDANLQPGTSLQNVAVVSSAAQDPSPLNNTDNADTSITSQADLAITKTGPATVTAGGNVTYTITLTNNGPSAAQNVDVKDLLPPGVSFVSGTASNGGVCVSGICQLGNIPNGQVVTITIVGKVDSGVPVGTQLTNTATVFSDSFDPNSGNNSASATSTVQVGADIRVSKVDLMDPVAPGEGLIYEIVVTNDGPSNALNVVATDILDPNVVFAGASPGCTHAAGVVTCTVGTLLPGQSASYLVAVKVKLNVADGATLTNQVGVSSPTPDSDPSDNTDSETTKVQAPLPLVADVAITKTGTPASVVAGQLVDYTLTVTNSGPEVATNVRVLELVPYGTTVVSITANNPDFTGEYCSLGGSCYLGSMTMTTVATIQVTLTSQCGLPGQYDRQHGAGVGRPGGHRPGGQHRQRHDQRDPLGRPVDRQEGPDRSGECWRHPAVPADREQQRPVGCTECPGQRHPAGGRQLCGCLARLHRERRPGNLQPRDAGRRGNRLAAGPGVGERWAARWNPDHQPGPGAQHDRRPGQWQQHGQRDDHSQAVAAQPDRPADHQGCDAEPGDRQPEPDLHTAGQEQRAGAGHQCYGGGCAAERRDLRVCHGNPGRLQQRRDLLAG